MVGFASMAMALLALTGCSQPITGVTGIAVSHGHVQGLVAVCPDETADELHMIPAGGQFFLIPHPTWTFQATQSGTVDLGSTEHFLAQVGDSEQSLQPTVSSFGVGGYLRFRSSDVRSLTDGQILASTATTRHNIVVDDLGFQKLLSTLCSDPY